MFYEYWLWAQVVDLLMLRIILNRWNICCEYKCRGPRGHFYSLYLYMRLCVVIVYIGTCYIQVLYLGRAPCTKETLPDFHEWHRVTRYPLVFRGLTGSQRTPGNWGVTAWYQSLGIRIPRELGFGYPSPLGWFDVEYRYMKT